MNAEEISYLNINPIIYTKVSLSFLTTATHRLPETWLFTMSEVSQTLQVDIVKEQIIVTIGTSNLVLSIDSNSNGMILGAAKYAIKNYPW